MPAIVEKEQQKYNWMLQAITFNDIGYNVKKEI